MATRNLGERGLSLASLPLLISRRSLHARLLQQLRACFVLCFKSSMEEYDVIT